METPADFDDRLRIYYGLPEGADVSRLYESEGASLIMLEHAVQNFKDVVAEYAGEILNTISKPFRPN